MPAHRIVFPFGALEGEEHPATDLERILEALEPGRQRLPLVVAEVGMQGPGGDDQVVVPQAVAVVEVDHPALDIHTGCLRQDDLGVLRVAKDRPDGRGDVARIEARRRHLVEHRLEEVVVSPVYHRDAHGRAS